ncbi:MAG: methyltransferase domain-containing protein [Gammaproteobacteria bacterium]
MAIIWQAYDAGIHYQVRSAGRTRRLYANGICHTEWHPERALTRSIWDLLMLPALLMPAGTIRRVLVLGVGGGSVIHLLRRHIQPEHIDGVELSRMHLKLARQFFGLRESKQLRLYAADAGQWLSEYRGSKFDLIIDDLFLEESSEAVRAIDADTGWFRLLLKNLQPEGILSINFADYNDVKQSGWATDKRMAGNFPAVFGLRTPYLDNVVGAFCRVPVQAGALRQHISGIPALAKAAGNKQLRYRLSRLTPASQGA